MLEEVDLSELSKEVREEEAKQEAQRVAGEPFQLSRGPLVRTKLLRLADFEHILLLTMHHIVSDGWSIGIMVRELSRLYGRYMKGEESSLSELTIQYADYATWQHDWLQSGALEHQMSYWRRQLAGMQPLDLPTDKARTKVRSHRSERVPHRLSSQLTKRLKELSRQEGTTLFMTLLAVFQVMLSRYSRQQDVAVGTAIANRNRLETEGLIGFFVNTLILRTRLEERMSFRQCLRQVRGTLLEAYQHQDVPFEKLVEELVAEREPNRNPLFQVMFVMQNTPRASLTLAGLDLQEVKVETQQAHLDLTMSVAERAGELECVLEYRSELWERQTMERLLVHWERLLEAAAVEVQTPIGKLEMLGVEERQQLLVEWNRTARGYLKEKCAPTLFEEQVSRTPEATAILYKDQLVSYCELNRRSNQLARYLRKRGVGPETLVALCMERGVEMMVGILGVLKAGGAYVPLDPSYPAERLSYILGDTRAPVLLVQDNLRSRMPRYSGRMVELVAEGAEIDRESADALEVISGSGNLAYVIYTSGSTGKPKGVLVEHRGLCNLATAQRELFQLGPGHHVLQFASASFDASVWEWAMALLSGSTLCLHDHEDIASPDSLARILAEYGIHTATLPPSMLAALREADLPDLQTVISAGELCPRSLVERWSPRRCFFNCYGPTETTVCATAARCDDRWRSGSIGRPIANTQVYILGDNLEPVPIGVPGELHIGGDGVTRGYLNQPSLTAERFVPDPFCSQHGARLYKTGDIARYLQDGSIEFLGRADGQVKIRGFRIEPGEIESVLLAFPKVAQAAVISQRGRAGDQRLVAYVVGTNSQEEIKSGELRTYLREKLPEYMVPSTYIELEKLPLTPNGKLDQRQLPMPDSRQEESVDAPPRTAEEEILCGIFAEVLKRDRVGAQQSFFELGGHSLLATQVTARVRQVFRVELPLRVLFEAPEVSELAVRIKNLREATHVPAPPLVPVDRPQELPLSYAQKRLWLIDHLELGSAVYNIPFSVRLRGELHKDAVKRSLNEILRRHEVLRTSFGTRDGKPVQEIRAELELEVEEADLSGWEEADRDEQARRMAQAEASKPFTLERGPLLRVKLLRMDREDHVLLATMHHIVSDAWSMGIMMREFSELYAAYRKGAKLPLPPLAIQYADFAIWQQQWLQGEVLAPQIEYWKKQLEGMPTFELPTDHRRPTVQNHRGAQLHFSLSAAFTNRLQELCRREGVTLFMSLLAAFDVVLWRYSGEVDVVVGTPIANRNRIETEGLIGFFANTLVLRLDLSGNPSFHELLGRARNTVLEAHAHQDVPFEKLVEELSPERELSQSPLFQVMLVLQNADSGRLELPGLRVSAFSSNYSAAKFDLLLAVSESADGLCGLLTYARDLYEASTMERLLEHFRVVLEAMVAEPGRCAREIPLVSAAERRQVLQEWNRTRVEYGQRCAHELFEEQVGRTPAAVAVEYEGKQLTYAELNRRANQLAHHLRSLGVGPEVRVGICMERSLEMMVGLLGILKAGGAYVPLDPTFPKERLGFILQDTQPLACVTQQRHLATMPKNGALAVCLEPNMNAARSEANENLEYTVKPDNLAYILYTSGSTGQPKAVAVEHKQLHNYIRAALDGMDLADASSFALVQPLTVDACLTTIFAALCTGGCLHLVSPDNAADPVSLMDYFRQHTIDYLKLAPSHLESLQVSKRVAQMIMPRRVLVIGGEPSRWEWVDGIRKLTNDGCIIYNQYGPAEATVGVLTYRVEKQERLAYSTLPLGRPLANTQVYLLDEWGEPVPVGLPGEVYIGGANVARCYVNRPDLTAERFLPDPFSSEPGARIYQTGDCARYLRDGNIEFLGRLDEQVKIRGFRVECNEIKTVLRQHPNVRETAVVGLADPRGGHRLIAYVVPGKHPAPTPRVLRDYLKTRLPGYMVPSEYVTLNALPLTPHGKLHRKALPVPTRWAGCGADYIAPGTDTELKLAAIFKEVLQVEKIGVHDNFFDMGGHSLAAVRLFALIEKQFGRRHLLATFFRNPTIKALAPVLGDQPDPPQASSLVSLRASGSKRPLFLVHPAGGNVFCYITLAQRLASDRPIHAFQSRPMDLDVEPSADVSEMAETYLNEMLGASPDGPYFLGGWSMGGVIAFEMACRLKARNLPVAMVALFDSYPSSANPISQHQDDYSRRLLAFARDLGLQPADIAALRAGTSDLTQDELLNGFIELASFSAGLDNREALRLLQTFMNNSQALREYVPRQFDGSVVLLKAAEQATGGYDLTTAWNAVATRGVHSYTVPGDHYSILREPNIAVLVEYLDLCLDQVEHNLQ
jgi:amino acid adenylation domain-containing protein